MKIINKILDFILISYFTALIIVCVLCAVSPEHAGTFFSCLYTLIQLFRFIIGIILVLVVSKLGIITEIKKNNKK